MPAMDSRNSRPSRNLTKILRKTKRGYVVYYLDDHRPRRSRDMSLRHFIAVLLCLTFLGFIAVQYILMNKFLISHQLARTTLPKGFDVTKNTPYMNEASLKNLSRQAIPLRQIPPLEKSDTDHTGKTTAPATVAEAPKSRDGGISNAALLSYKMAAPDVVSLRHKMADPKQLDGLAGKGGVNETKDGVLHVMSNVAQQEEQLANSNAAVFNEQQERKLIMPGGIQLRSNTSPTKIYPLTSGQKHSRRIVENVPRELVFFVVICKGHPDNIMTDVRRQMRQCEVMLKSAVAFTDSLLRFIVCTDAIEVYRVLVEVTSMWAAEHRSRIFFERRPVWFPPGRPDLQGIRWPCSTAKLFQAHQLQDLDAVIYLDTDVIFLVPPENLWQEFSKFDSDQVLGMASEAPADPREPPRHDQEPRHTPHGLNTGVILMNLTRLRQFPGRGWIGEVVTAFDTFVTAMTSTPSNRLVNAILSQYPNLVRELGCEWNYVSKLCQGGDITCPQVWKRGVSLLHGYGHHFYYDSPKFMAVYQAWRNYELATPPKDLLETLQKNLEAATTGRLWPGCESIIDIDQVFVDPMRRTISNYLVNRLRRFVTQVYESFGLRRDVRERGGGSDFDFKM
ncbi:glucoside xylosyltransferase 1-like isoform X2 [Penaeus japonicus]|uniref:glucoside xylosyltransferase 1-like isoform X2 n=1 Tax=Penaeus japonicus TaxID=27405 RepID=UPI001C70E84C|nr:glucoside xylosyltransferase 1-like isoform X2 [Penaeus japonicus]